jgi:hypothetical protein
MVSVFMTTTHTKTPTRCHHHHQPLMFSKQTLQMPTSNIQQSTISTSIKESKIFRELKEACARQATMFREMEFRKSRGRSRTLRNLGACEVLTSIGEKTPAQLIASTAIASSILPAEDESKEKMEGGNHVNVRRGMNLILSRARIRTE